MTNCNLLNVTTLKCLMAFLATTLLASCASLPRYVSPTTGPIAHLGVIDQKTPYAALTSFLIAQNPVACTQLHNIDDDDSDTQKTVAIPANKLTTIMAFGVTQGYGMGAGIQVAMSDFFSVSFVPEKNKNYSVSISANNATGNKIKFVFRLLQAYKKNGSLFYRNVPFIKRKAYLGGWNNSISEKTHCIDTKLMHRLTKRYHSS